MLASHLQTQQRNAHASGSRARRGAVDDDQRPQAGPSIRASSSAAAAARRVVNTNGGADTGSDDDIQFLDEAPTYMRNRTTYKAPIVVDSDSDDDNTDNPFLVGKRKRAQEDDGDEYDEYDDDSIILIGSDIVDLPPSPRTRLRLANKNAHAGPSVRRVIFADDGDDEVKPADAGVPSTPPLPEAHYLVPLVLAIIPDICPDWVRANIEAAMAEIKDNSNVPGQDAIDRVLNAAFEMDDYPKAGVQDAPAEPKEAGDYTDPNYRSGDRRGVGYTSNSWAMLKAIFPVIPVAQ